MARAKTNKLYRTFTKGLITEAGYLTYPEDASIAEMNTVISRKGNRTRRLGIDYEDDYVLSAVDIDDTKAFNEFVWYSVNNDPAFNFVVVQVGTVIHFYSLDNIPISDNKKSFTLDLAPYKIAGVTEADVGSQPASFASGAGYLFMAHPYTEPLSIEYSVAADSITAVSVIIQIRDFEGVYDGLANDAEPSTLSKEHYYNLLNQGWASPGTTPTEFPGAPGAPGQAGGVTEGNGAIAGGGGVYYDPYTGSAEQYRRVDPASNEQEP